MKTCGAWRKHAHAFRSFAWVCRQLKWSVPATKARRSNRAQIETSVRGTPRATITKQPALLIFHEQLVERLLSSPHCRRLPEHGTRVHAIAWVSAGVCCRNAAYAVSRLEPRDRHDVRSRRIGHLMTKSFWLCLTAIIRSGVDLHCDRCAFEIAEALCRVEPSKLKSAAT